MSLQVEAAAWRRSGGERARSRTARPLWAGAEAGTGGEGMGFGGEGGDAGGDLGEGGVRYRPVTVGATWPAKAWATG